MQEIQGRSIGELCVVGREDAALRPARVHARVWVRPALARVALEQVFELGDDEAGALVYMFPKAFEGALCALELEAGDQRVVGVVREREAAREVFEQARAARQPAAIVEEARANMMRLELTGVAPGSTVRVRLTIDEALSWRGDRWVLRLPLTITPRHEDRTLMDAGPAAGGVFEGPAAATVEVRGVMGCALARVISPSHALERRAGHRPERGSLDLRLALDEAPDRDVVLELWPQREPVVAASASCRADGGRPGAFLVSLVADAAPPEETIAPREVIFVLDRSGSMGGGLSGESDAMGAAKRALRACLRTLRAGDTFNILAFDDRLEALFEQATPWEQGALDLADRALGLLSSRGGTDIARALVWALTQPVDAARVRLVVFLTDGAVGNERSVLELVKAHLGAARIFTFGIGRAVNDMLIRELARIGRGTAELVMPDQDIEDAVFRFHNHVSSPVLTALEVELDAPGEADLLPDPLPDLYAGQALEIVGLLPEGRRPEHLTLRGQRASGPFTQRVALPAQDDPDGAVARHWASRRAAWLTEQIAAHAEHPELHDALVRELVGLGEHFHIVTAHTSLVAAPDATRPITRMPERVRLPEMPPRQARDVGELRAAPLPTEQPPAPATPLTARRLTSATPSPPLPLDDAQRAEVAALCEAFGLAPAPLLATVDMSVNDEIARAEDPERHLEVCLQHVRAQLLDLKRGLAQMIAATKRAQPELADGVELVKTTLRHLNAREEEIKRKRDLLIARKKRVEAQKTIQATMSSLGPTSAFDSFERMSEHIDALEAEAEASDDDALAQLKARMSQESAPEAPEPSPSAPSPSTPAAAAATSRALDRSRRPLYPLGSAQRASGAWGDGRDDVRRTALALARFALAGETHRAGGFRVQLQRAWSWLLARVDEARGGELWWLAWALEIIARQTGDAEDVARAEAALSRASEDRDALPAQVGAWRSQPEALTIAALDAALADTGR